MSGADANVYAYAVVRVEEESDYGRHLRIVDNRCWRRLLRRVTP